MNYSQRIWGQLGTPQGRTAPALQSGMEFWPSGPLPTTKLHFGAGKSFPDSLDKLPAWLES